MAGPYSGLRVLDLSQVIAGPFCTRLLSDLGADVIRVETRGGDILRELPISYAEGLSTSFAQYNCGKRSVGIDLKSEDGHTLIEGLVAWADIMVENFSPGVLSRLGLTWDEVHALNPQLILCSISLFGGTGPYSSISGHGMVAEAYSGLMSLTGEEGGSPSHFGTPLADMNAAVHALAGIGAALHARTRSGEGSLVDVSSFDSLFAMIDQAVGQAVITHGERDFGRYGTKHPQTVPSGVLMTRDRGAATFSAVGDAAWKRLTEAMGRPALASDPRFETIEARITNRAELYAECDRWASDFPTAESLVEELSKWGLPAARVRSVRENVQDPHLIERGTLSPVDLGGEVGEVLVQSAPYRISGTDVGPQGPPPLLGEHNSEVLRDVLGLSDAEIKNLSDSGIIYGKEHR